MQPCVYWPGTGAPLAVLLEAGGDIVATKPVFAAARSVPAACMACAYLETCRGGCSGRRQLLQALHDPHSYCPILRGKRRKLEVRRAAARDMPKLESACTTIVMAR